LKSGTIKTVKDIKEAGLDQCRRGHETCGISELPDLLDILEDWNEMNPSLSRDRFGQGDLGDAAMWMYMMASEKWTDIRELVQRGIGTLFQSQDIGSSG